MKYRITLALSYPIVAVAITALWVYKARTEYWPNDHSSIVHLADGTAGVPFVKRRLLPDVARGLAAVVPAPAWDLLRQSLVGDGPVATLLRPLVSRQAWAPEDYPLLFSAYFLIGCSALGFMWTCRWLVNLLYECPRWVADLLGCLAGLALLGGCPWAVQAQYICYPYDWPSCFLFTLTLAGMLGRRWWFVPAFAAAAYCKETAVLLILAYALVGDRRRLLHFVKILGLMLAIYLGVRAVIDLNYPSPANTLWGGYWYPRRNAVNLVRDLAHYVWLLPVLVVGAVRFAHHWSKYPARFRRLTVLLVPLLGLGFFMGWFEEKRQYLEVLGVFGVLVSQWLLIELGLGRLLRPRPEWQGKSSGTRILSARLAAEETPLARRLEMQPQEMRG